MAQTKISERLVSNPATALDGTEAFFALQAGVTKAATVEQVKAYVVPQDNMTATADPTTTDDSAAGYSTRSRWYNTSTGEAYLCVDATAGAAVWVKATLTLDELGSAATEDASAFATAAQGETADDAETLIWQGV